MIAPYINKNFSIFELKGFPDAVRTYALIFLEEKGIVFNWKRPSTRCDYGILIDGLEYPFPTTASERFIEFCFRLTEDLSNFEELKTEHFFDIFNEV